MTTASTGSTDSRRSVNVRASTDMRSAHCRSSTTMATAPADCCPLTTSSNRAPAANDETGGAVPPVPASASTGGAAPPAARSNWSTIPRSRSVSAGSARADSTFRSAACARQCRTRDVFPMPGSPSMATSHGSPAWTRVMTSVIRAISADRPTKTSSGTGLCCTSPPHSRPWSPTADRYEPNR